MTAQKIFLQKPENKDWKVWRYMGLINFVDLLQRRALWFSRIDCFKDPYEGFFSGDPGTVGSDMRRVR